MSNSHLLGTDGNRRGRGGSDCTRQWLWTLLCAPLRPPRPLRLTSPLSILLVIPLALVWTFAGGAEGPADNKAPSKKTALKPAKKEPAVRKAPPESLPLPAAGEYPAEKLLDIAASLWGMPLVTDGRSVDEAKVLIPPERAGRQVKRQELEDLLCTFRIYLHTLETEEGSTLVATRSTTWAPERFIPTYTRRFEVRSRNFEALVDEVKGFLAKKNDEAPAGLPPAGAAANPRTRTIIVRAPSRKTLAGVEAIIKKGEEPDPSEVRLFTFRPRHQPARQLVEKAREVLSAEEAKGVSIVASGAGNALLIRASEEVYKRIEEALRKHDVPQPPTSARKKRE